MLQNRRPIGVPVPLNGENIPYRLKCRLKLPLTILRGQDGQRNVQLNLAQFAEEVGRQLG